VITSSKNKVTPLDTENVMTPQVISSNVMNPQVLTLTDLDTGTKGINYNYKVIYLI